MSLAESLALRLPSPLREIVLKHRELVKFALVGGICYLVDTALFLSLKSLVLPNNPVTAKIIATLIATILSYILNRQWSFRTRGGRAKGFEASLFLIVNGGGIVLSSAPLWISRYVFHLQEPSVNRITEGVADFVSAQIIGTLLAMAFRWYGYKKWVFPIAGARPKESKDHERLATATAESS